MDKLVEGDAAPRGSLTAAPAYAVQFFLIPLAVVAVTVAVYLGFRSLVTDERTAQEYLAIIQTGGMSDRWPAAYELSRLMADPEVAGDPTLGPALVNAFTASKGENWTGWCGGFGECPPVRRYLALAMGRLMPPLPPDAIPALVEALGDPDSETVINTIWALGSLGDPSVVPYLEAMYESTDVGVRKVTVYVLGALPGDGQDRVLATALNDTAVDVRWNAAVALARHRNREGVPVLRRMLDRPYVEETVIAQRTPGRTGENAANRSVFLAAEEDPVGEVMISALQAVAALQETSLRAHVAELSREEPNLRVREAAMETLKALGPAS